MATETKALAIMPTLSLGECRSAPIRSEKGALISFRKSGLEKPQYRELKREFYKENRVLMAGALTMAQEGKADVKFSVRKNKDGAITGYGFSVVKPQTDPADDAALRADEAEKRAKLAEAKLAELEAKLAAQGIE